MHPESTISGVSRAGVFLSFSGRGGFFYASASSAQVASAGSPQVMKIYTRKGDKGKTSLFGGKCVQKSNIRVEAYGTVDELNSVIAVAQSQISKLKSQNYILKLKSELTEIQNDLFEIGSIIANPNIHLRQGFGGQAKYLKKRVGELEKTIDEMVKQLPEIHNFIIPGGGEAGSLLHFCRTICRRAERRIVTLSKKEKTDKKILVYLNRLSDFLFISARFVNHKENKKEIIWRKK